MQFNRAKLKAVILHTCNSCPPDRLGAVKLHKMLYFLDMISYAQSGSAVTWATYNKRPFGPTCVQFLPTLAEMARAGEIEIRDVAFHGLRKKEYVAKVAAPAGLLSPDEISLLDDVIDFVCNRNSALTISDFSHQLPWEMADFGKEIPYRSALLLFPAEVSPEAFERVSEEANDIEAARSRSDTLGLPVLAALRGSILEAAGQA